MKIYLIGSLYDDFCSEGFHVVGVASDAEKANAMYEYFKDMNEDEEYEIREWEVDVIEPVTGVERRTYIINDIQFPADVVNTGYKRIKSDSRYNPLKEEVDVND